MKIIDAANNLGIMLRDSEEFENFRNAEIKFLNDKELQEQFEEYKNLRIAYLNNKNSDLEDIINSKYDKLLMNPTFKEYVELKDKFENLLFTVEQLINYHIGYYKNNCCFKKRLCNKRF